MTNDQFLLQCSDRHHWVHEPLKLKRSNRREDGDIEEKEKKNYICEIWFKDEEWGESYYDID